MPMFVAFPQGAFHHVRRHHKDATGVEHLPIVKPDEDYEVRSHVTLEQRRRGPILLD